MAFTVQPTNPESETFRPRRRNIPNGITRGNCNPEDADVVIYATKNHYDEGRQNLIASGLRNLTQEGDVVLTEGEPFGGRLKSSWIPETKGLNTGKVELRGWENGSLYNQAKDIVQSLTQDIHTLNFLSGISLGQCLKPYIDTLKRRVSEGMRDMDRVVLNARSNAMCSSIMNVLGNGLQQGSTLFVYAGAAHTTPDQLNGLKANYVVKEI